MEAVEIETILAAAKPRYRVLYALLAGSGLRIAEALGLEIGKHLSPDCSILFIRQQRSKKGTGIEPYPKTDAGLRDVDLDPVERLVLVIQVESERALVHVAAFHRLVEIPTVAGVR